MTFISGGSTKAKFAKMLLGVLALGLIAPAVGAQFSDSYNFLKYVKERKGTEATALIEEPGSIIINTKDDVTGQTALHIVIERRDEDWLGFLLQKGANPNIADKKGVTPLILATQLNFKEGVEWLLKNKAAVDGVGRVSTTPLIMAVQVRNLDMVRLLMKYGANPDKQETGTGRSARDYATMDGRGNAILAELEKKGADKKPAGKDLDFRGIPGPK
jgi:ankyrin repeat protein